jgi:acylaminoacyl-peptidase
LDNGAEACFVSRNDLDSSKKHPMIVIVHGGPFGASSFDMFTFLRSLFLMQGYTILILNYRGSTGYGESFMNELLGNIGKNDIEDCIGLIKKALD